MARLSFLATPVFVMFAFIAPIGFPIIFGEEWRAAGWYASANTSAAFLYLFNRCINRLFDANNSQHISFSVEFIFDSLLFVLLASLLHLGVPNFFCVLLFSLGSCAYHITCLVMAFRVARFKIIPLLRIGVFVSFLIAILSICFSSILVLNSTFLFVLFGCSFVVAVYFVVLFANLNHYTRVLRYLLRDHEGTVTAVFI